MSRSWRPRPGDIPDSPGCYQFRDLHGRVIYVGKARSLRSRVPSYFSTGLHPRTVSMVSAAASVEWIVTSNEVEALQLEVSLIKQHRPSFNVRYRDDKSYPYLVVSLGEEIPRAMVTRGRKRKDSRYYGPYTHAYAIRETLDLLLKVFPIRSCSKGVFDRARRARRPCLLYDIGRCSGPCVGAVSAQQHREIVARFCDFMDGEHQPVLRSLREQMEAAANDMEYERAARARDQLAAVRQIIEKQEMVTEKAEDIDAVSYWADDLEAAFQVFFIRRGRVVGRKGFIVDRVEDLSEEELVGTFLENLYSEDWPLPREVIVPVLPPSPEVLAEWLSAKRGSSVRLRVPKKGAKKKLLETINHNAREAFTQSRLKRSSDFAARAKALNELAEQLSLPEAPLRIECFDISNLGPTEVVGAMVVFEDGLPKKSDYRKFKIRTVAGQDDVGSMGEVIFRRFRQLQDAVPSPPDPKKKFAYPPALVVVDGGKGQLNRAIDVMSDLGIVGIPVVSLAKRLEEVFVPGEAQPRVIPRGSEALYLLQRIRDEAHRFAIGYQRTRRTKTMTESVLDDVAGIGPGRRRLLLQQFGSPKGLSKASRDEIAGVPGIGPELAGRIYEHLRTAV